MEKPPARPRMLRSELVKLRKRAQLTQEEASELSGVSRRMWIRYEDGSARIPHKVADAARAGFPGPEPYSAEEMRGASFIPPLPGSAAATPAPKPPAAPIGRLFRL